jgi:hypothetical protein
VAAVIIDWRPVRIIDTEMAARNSDMTLPKAFDIDTLYYVPGT